MFAFQGLANETHTGSLKFVKIPGLYAAASCDNFHWYIIISHPGNYHFGWIYFIWKKIYYSRWTPFHVILPIPRDLLLSVRVNYNSISFPFLKFTCY